MKMRLIGLLVALSAAGCRQATPAEVGAQTRRDAFPQATTMAADRAYQASPDEVPASATGAAIRQPPQPRN